jgi:PII-like signaling protein
VNDALKLTVYFGERDRAGGRLLADELLDRFGALRVEASVLLRGVEGFGRRPGLRTDRLLTLAEDLPAVAIAIERRERIEPLMAAVRGIADQGLITLERARLLAGAGGVLELPAELSEAVKLTVFLRRRERVARVPAFVAVCDLLRRGGIAGATALLGVDGTRRGQRARAAFFGRNADVPVIVVAVGAGERVARVVPEIARLLEDPLLAVERVRVCKRDGSLLAMPHELPATDGHGLALWQKLSVHASQAASAGGRPLHAELIHRLREADAAGATAVRGIWGFNGDHRPRGDALLAVRRRVPMVTIALEPPQRAARTFAIIDELTAAQGLVTVEMVPALSAAGTAPARDGLRLASHRF